jgi:hypothetical protein
MNNEDLKLPDDFFKQQFENFEAPYHEGAWEDMRSLLDASDRKKPFIFWYRKNKKTSLILITITMITTSILTVLSLFTSHSAQHTTQKTNGATLQPNTELSASKQELPAQTPGYTNPTHEENTASATTYTSASNQSTHTANGRNNVSHAAATNTTSTAVNDASAESSETPAVEGEENPTTPEKLSPVNTGPVVTKTSDPTETTTNKVYPAYTTFKGPWLGIHFTMQYPETPKLHDSNRQNAGFNFQMMSNNMLDRHDFGLHLGGDFGVQWYGRTKNYGVVLNNTELDSGFTRLSTHSFDFFFRGHFEYGRFRLKPYVNAFAGPRIYGTTQYTEAYHHKTDYENSSNTNAFTSASLMYGGALGARFAVSKHVSLDLRYEFMQGTTTQMVDLDKSTFNGLSNFQVSKFRVDPIYSQIKFGVLFDLWDGHTEQETVKNNEVVEETEYFYYDSSTQQYIKVNCKCKETPQSQDSTTETRKVKPTPFRPEDEVTPDENNTPIIIVPGSGRSRSGSGGSGGSRGSFPGIKPGGKIKS